MVVKSIWATWWLVRLLYSKNVLSLLESTVIVWLFPWLRQGTDKDWELYMVVQGVSQGPSGTTAR